MGDVLRRCIATLLVAAIVCTWLPPRAAGEDAPSSVRHDFLRTGAMNFMLAQPDTTESPFDFPEEKENHLVRDIAVFVVVSAFVAYFIIKVFLEGDTDQPESDSGGKNPSS